MQDKEPCLTGKHSLVCGASQGIGRACAEEIARLGASITVLAREEGALKSVATGLHRAAGQTHSVLVADTSDVEGLGRKIVQWVQSAGPCHILVNNSGGPSAGPLMEAATKQLMDGFTAHVLAFQVLAQAVVPGMKAAGYGRIINIISTSVVMPIAGLGVSNTTRGAVANWGRTLAGELGPYGITVNNILPGFTSTDRLRSMLARKAQRLGKTPEEVEAASRACIPLGRFAAPREIAAVVAFLASPSASYVSGVNLPVDGGRTAVQ